MAVFDGWKLVAEWPLSGLTDGHGLASSSPEARAVVERGWEAADALAARPLPANPRRRDTEELRAFMDRAARVSGRIQQVFELCIRQGLSLTECAERLGISRETVRVHLRRLRALRLESVRRDALRSR